MTDHTSIEDLETRVAAIEERNRRVEGNKAWETSVVRKIVIIAMTYILVVLVMYAMDISRPWINAIIPSLGFFLSTITLPVVKRWYLARSFSSMN